MQNKTPKGNFSSSKRLIALFLSVSLALSNGVGYAVPASSVGAALRGRDSGQPQRVAPAVNIQIPPELGKIEESFSGTSSKTIIYIQDAHDSLEAQENIAKIIHYLADKYDVKTVYEEGYEGPVPTDKYFGTIRDPKIREKVAYFLMDKLRIGGAEYAHITRPHPPTTKTSGPASGGNPLPGGEGRVRGDFELIGADSLKLHKKGIERYQESEKHRKKTEKDLAEMDAAVRKLAQRYFTKDLKAWMEIKERFDRQEIELLDYLKRTLSLRGGLKGLSSTNAFAVQQPFRAEDQKGLRSYPAIALLLAAEKSKDPVKKGTVREVLPVPFLPLLSQIDAKTLFGEINRFEDDYAKAHLKEARDREIFRYYKLIQLLKRLNAIKVTEDEYEAVKENLKEVDTAKIAKFLAAQSHKSVVLSKTWETHIQSAIGFYEIAKERDAAIEKTLKEPLSLRGAPAGATKQPDFKKQIASPSARNDETPVILVYGGFHKENIKSILRRKGFSYYVVTPKITSISAKHQEYYKQLMRMGYDSIALPTLVTKATRAPNLLMLAELDGRRSEARIQGLIHRIEQIATTEKKLVEMDLAWTRNQAKFHEKRVSAAIRSEMRSKKIPFNLQALADWSRTDNAQWRVDITSLPLGRLRDFFQRLNELGLDEVVVVGGAVRDTLLGQEPGDIDFGLKISLPPALEKQFEEDVKQLAPIELDRKYQLSYRAEKTLHPIAKRLGISPKKLFRLEEKFGDSPLEYSFSTFMVGPYLIDASFQAGFTIDQIAMDRHGRIYQPFEGKGLEDLRSGLVVISPKPSSRRLPVMGLKTTLKAIRYKHQWGFRFDSETERLVSQASSVLLKPIQVSLAVRLWRAVRVAVRELYAALRTPELAMAHLRVARRSIGRILRGGLPKDVPSRWFKKALDSVRDREAFLHELEKSRVLDGLRQMGVPIEELTSHPRSEMRQGTTRELTGRPEGIELYEKEFSEAPNTTVHIGSDIGHTAKLQAAFIIRAIQLKLMEKGPTGDVAVLFATGKTQWMGLMAMAKFLNEWGQWDPEMRRFLRVNGVDLERKPDMRRVIASHLDTVFPQKRTDYNAYANQLNNMFDKLGIPPQKRLMFYGDVKAFKRGQTIRPGEAVSRLSNKEFAAIQQSVEQEGLRLKEFQEGKLDRNHPQYPYLEAMTHYAEAVSLWLLKLPNWLAKLPRWLSKPLKWLLRLWNWSLKQGGPDIAIFSVGGSYEGKGHIAFNETGTPFGQGVSLQLLGYHAAAGNLIDNGGMWTWKTKVGEELKPRFGAVTLGPLELVANPNTINVMIITGKEKRESVRHMIESEKNPEYPATVLQGGAPGSVVIVEPSSASSLRYSTHPWDFRKIKEKEWTDELRAQVFIQLSKEIAEKTARPKPVKDLMVQDYFDAQGRESREIMENRRANLESLLQSLRQALPQNPTWEGFRDWVAGNIERNVVKPEEVAARVGLEPDGAILHIGPHLDDLSLAAQFLVNQWTTGGRRIYSHYIGGPGWTAVSNLYLFDALRTISEFSASEIQQLVRESVDEETFQTHDEKYLKELIEVLKQRTPNRDSENYDVWPLMNPKEQRLRAKILFLRMNHQSSLNGLITNPEQIKALGEVLRFYASHSGQWGSSQLELMQDLKVFLRFMEEQTELMSRGVSHKDIFYPITSSWVGAVRTDTVKDKDVQRMIEIIENTNPAMIMVNGEGFMDHGAHALTEMTVKLALWKLMVTRRLHHSPKLFLYRGVWDRTEINGTPKQVLVALTDGDLEDNKRSFSVNYPSQSPAQAPDASVPRPKLFPDRVVENAKDTRQEFVVLTGTEDLARGYPGLLAFNYEDRLEDKAIEQRFISEVVQKSDELDRVRLPIKEWNLTKVNNGDAPYPDLLGKPAMRARQILEEAGIPLDAVFIKTEKVHEAEATGLANADEFKPQVTVKRTVFSETAPNVFVEAELEVNHRSIQIHVSRHDPKMYEFYSANGQKKGSVKIPFSTGGVFEMPSDWDLWTGFKRKGEGLLREALEQWLVEVSRVRDGGGQTIGLISSNPLLKVIKSRTDARSEVRTEDARKRLINYFEKKRGESYARAMQRRSLSKNNFGLPPFGIALRPENYQSGIAWVRDMRPWIIEIEDRAIDQIADLSTSDSHLRNKAKRFAKSFLNRADLVDSLSMFQLEDILYEIIEKETQNPDPYKDIRGRLVSESLKKLNEIEAFVASSGDPLRAAFLMSVAANEIDFANPANPYPGKFNFEQMMEQLRRGQISFGRDDYDRVRSRLQSPSPLRLLILADNAGEFEASLPLYKRLLLMGHQLTFTGKQGPATNDKTAQEIKTLFKKPEVQAFFKGPGGENLAERIRIESDGSRFTGINLRRLPPGFIEAWKAADLVLMSGHGHEQQFRFVRSGFTRDLVYLNLTKEYRTLGALYQPGSFVIEFQPHGAVLPNLFEKVGIESPLIGNFLFEAFGLRVSEVAEVLRKPRSRPEEANIELKTHDGKSVSFQLWTGVSERHARQAERNFLAGLGPAARFLPARENQPGFLIWKPDPRFRVEELARPLFPEAIEIGNGMALKALRRIRREEINPLIITSERSLEALTRICPECNQALKGLPILKVPAVYRKYLDPLLAKAREHHPGVIVSIGRGASDEWAKWLGKELDLDVFSIPTSLSTIVPLGYKLQYREELERNQFRIVTISAGSAKRVYYDLALLTSDPEGIRALIGDTLTTYTALKDWELSISRGRDPPNEPVWRMARKTLEDLEKDADLIRSLSPEGIHRLIEILIPYVRNMVIIGSGRPASGSEHIVAAYVEKILHQYHLDKDLRILHGNQVFILALLMAHLQGQDIGFLKRMAEKFHLPLTPEAIGLHREIVIAALEEAQPRPDRFTWFDLHRVKPDEAQRAAGAVFGKVPEIDFVAGSSEKQVTTRVTIPYKGAKVPDPFTQMLADSVAETILPAIEPDSWVLEMGTGSGAVASTVAAYSQKHSRNLKIVVTDITSEAVKTAWGNIVFRYKLPDRATSIQSNLFEKLSSPSEDPVLLKFKQEKAAFKLILFNPPIMPATKEIFEQRLGPQALANYDYLLEEGKDFTDGLGILRKFLSEADDFLDPRGQAVVVLPSYIGKEKIQSAFTQAGFEARIIGSRRAKVRHGGVTWSQLELIGKVSGYQFFDDAGHAFSNVGEAKALGQDIYYDLLVFSAQLAPRGAEVRVHHLTEAELTLLAGPDERVEKEGRITFNFNSKRERDDTRIKSQVIRIEKALGKSEANANAKADEVLKFVNEKKSNFKGEEVHILNGTSLDAKVTGRIDRKIAEKFGYVHETANVILLALDGSVILQLRNKDTYDDHLAMYGEHLEVGESHANAALAETKQETGIEDFQNPHIFIGYASYDEPGDNNRERRSWFLQRLTEQEWAKMKQKRAEDEAMVGASHSTDDRAAYKQKLSQLWSQGKGEVTGVYTFTVDQITAASQKPNPASKLSDKNNRYLPVTDTFQEHEVIINAFFTPDAFDRLIKNPELWAKVQEHARAEVRSDFNLFDHIVFQSGDKPDSVSDWLQGRIEEILKTDLEIRAMLQTALSKYSQIMIVKRDGFGTTETAEGFLMAVGGPELEDPAKFDAELLRQGLAHESAHLALFALGRQNQKDLSAAEISNTMGKMRPHHFEDAIQAILNYEIYDYMLQSGYLNSARSNLLATASTGYPQGADTKALENAYLNNPVAHEYEFDYALLYLQLQAAKAHAEQIQQSEMKRWQAILDNNYTFIPVVIRQILEKAVQRIFLSGVAQNRQWVTPQILHLLVTDLFTVIESDVLQERLEYKKHRRAEVRSLSEWVEEAKSRLVILEVAIYQPGRASGSGTTTYVTQVPEWYAKNGITSGVVSTVLKGAESESFPFQQHRIELDQVPLFDAHPTMPKTIAFREMGEVDFQAYVAQVSEKLSSVVEGILAEHPDKQVVMNIHHGGALGVAALKVSEAVNARLGGKRVFYGIQGHNMEILFHEGFPSYIKEAFRKAAQHAAYFEALLPRHAEDAVALYGLDPNKVTVIPHGIDTALFSPRSGQEPRQLPAPLSLIDRKNSNVLLYAGRLVEGKGVLEALDGFRIYLETQPEKDTYFVIAGDGAPAYRDQLLAAIRQMPEEVSRKVIYLGFVPQWNLPFLYDFADAVTLLSDSEGLGRVILEAFAMGKPVLASDIPGIRASFAPPGALSPVSPSDLGGMVGDYKNPRIVAEELRRLFTKVNRGEFDPERIRRHVLENFSMEALLKNKLSLYVKIAGPRAAGPEAQPRGEVRMVENLDSIRTNFLELLRYANEKGWLMQVENTGYQDHAAFEFNKNGSPNAQAVMKEWKHEQFISEPLEYFFHNRTEKTKKKILEEIIADRIRMGKWDQLTTKEKEHFLQLAKAAYVRMSPPDAESIPNEKETKEKAEFLGRIAMKRVRTIDDYLEVLDAVRELSSMRDSFVIPLLVSIHNRESTMPFAGLRYIQEMVRRSIIRWVKPDLLPSYLLPVLVPEELDSRLELFYEEILTSTAKDLLHVLKGDPAIDFFLQWLAEDKVFRVRLLAVLGLAEALEFPYLYSINQKYEEKMISALKRAVLEDKDPHIRIQARQVLEKHQVPLEDLDQAIQASYRSQGLEPVFLELQAKRELYWKQADPEKIFGFFPRHNHGTGKQLLQQIGKVNIHGPYDPLLVEAELLFYGAIYPFDSRAVDYWDSRVAMDVNWESSQAWARLVSKFVHQEEDLIAAKNLLLEWQKLLEPLKLGEGIKKILNQLELESHLIRDLTDLNEKFSALIGTVSEQDFKVTKALQERPFSDVIKYPPKSLSVPSRAEIENRVRQTAGLKILVALHAAMNPRSNVDLVLFYPGANRDILTPLQATGARAFVFVDPMRFEMIKPLLTQEIERAGGKLERIEQDPSILTKYIFDFTYQGRLHRIYYYFEQDAFDENFWPKELEQGFDVYYETNVVTSGSQSIPREKISALHKKVKQYLRTGGFVAMDYPGDLIQKIYGIQREFAEIPLVQEGGFFHLLYKHQSVAEVVTSISTEELIEKFSFLSLVEVEALEKGEGDFKFARERGWTLEKFEAFLKGLTSVQGIPLNKKVKLISDSTLLFHIAIDRENQTYTINLGNQKASPDSVIQASRYMGKHESIHEENISNEEMMVAQIKNAFNNSDGISALQAAQRLDAVEVLVKEAEEVLTDALTLMALGPSMLEEAYPYFKEGLEYFQQHLDQLPNPFMLAYRSVTMDKFAEILPSDHPLQQEYHRMANQWAQLAMTRAHRDNYPALPSNLYNPFESLFDTFYRPRDEGRSEVRVEDDKTYWTEFWQRMRDKAKQAEKVEGGYIRFWRAYFQSWKERQPDARILEIGAGAPLRILRVAKETLPTLQMAGIDIVKPYEKVPEKIDFRQMSVESMTFEDNSFNAVIGTHALEFTSSYEHALAEIFRVLNPGGEVAFVVHHPEEVGIRRTRHEVEQIEQIGHLKIFQLAIESLTKNPGRRKEARRGFRDAFTKITHKTPEVFLKEAKQNPATFSYPDRLLGNIWYWITDPKLEKQAESLIRRHEREMRQNAREWSSTLRASNEWKDAETIRARMIKAGFESVTVEPMHDEKNEPHGWIVKALKLPRSRAEVRNSGIEMARLFRKLSRNFPPSLEREREFVSELLIDDQPGFRAQGVFALKDLPREVSEPILDIALEDTEVSVRTAAFKLIGENRLEKYIPLLLETLNKEMLEDDKHYEFRRAVYGAAGSLLDRSPLLYRALVDRLEESLQPLETSDEKIPFAALEIVQTLQRGKEADERLQSLLLKALKDETHEKHSFRQQFYNYRVSIALREEAARALGRLKIKDSQTRKLLFSLLKSGEPGVIYGALLALGEIGFGEENARELLSELEEMLGALDPKNINEESRRLLRKTILELRLKLYLFEPSELGSLLEAYPESYGYGGRRKELPFAIFSTYVQNHLKEPGKVQHLVNVLASQDEWITLGKMAAFGGIDPLWKDTIIDLLLSKSPLKKDAFERYDHSLWQYLEDETWIQILSEFHSRRDEALKRLWAAYTYESESGLALEWKLVPILLALAKLNGLTERHFQDLLEIIRNPSVGTSTGEALEALGHFLSWRFREGRKAIENSLEETSSPQQLKASQREILKEMEALRSVLVPAKGLHPISVGEAMANLRKSLEESIGETAIFSILPFGEEKVDFVSTPYQTKYYQTITYWHETGRGLGTLEEERTEMHRIGTRAHIRGTIKGAIESPEGFLRLDPSVSAEEFLRSFGIRPSISRALYHRFLIEKLTDTIRVLGSTGGVHPDKELILLPYVREIFEEWGYSLLSKMTLRTFLDVISGKAPAVSLAPPVGTSTERGKAEIVESVEVAYEQGIHVGPATLLVRAFQGLREEYSLQKADVFLRKVSSGEVVNALDLFALLGLGIDYGEKIEVEIRGEGEERSKRDFLQKVKEILSIPRGYEEGYRFSKRIPFEMLDWRPETFAAQLRVNRDPDFNLEVLRHLAKELDLYQIATERLPARLREDSDLGDFMNNLSKFIEGYRRSPALTSNQLLELILDKLWRTDAFYQWQKTGRENSPYFAEVWPLLRQNLYPPSRAEVRASGEAGATVEELMEDIQILSNDTKKAGARNLTLLESVRARIEKLGARLTPVYASLLVDGLIANIFDDNQRGALKSISDFEKLVTGKNQLTRALEEKTQALKAKIVAGKHPSERKKNLIAGLDSTVSFLRTFGTETEDKFTAAITWGVKYTLDKEPPNLPFSQALAERLESLKRLAEVRGVPQVRLVLLDLDGVLVPAPELTKQWERVARELEDRFGASFQLKDPVDLWRNVFYLGDVEGVRVALERGSINSEDYMSQVNQKLSQLLGKPVNLTFGEWMEMVYQDRLHGPEEVNEEIRQTIQSLKIRTAGSMEFGLLSDRIKSDRNFFNRLMGEKYPGVFPEELQFLSDELGGVKRDGSVFPMVLERLRKIERFRDIRPEEILLVDDRETNLQEAKKFGLRAAEFLYGRDSLTSVLQKELPRAEMRAKNEFFDELERYTLTKIRERVDDEKTMAGKIPTREIAHVVETPSIKEASSFAKTLASLALQAGRNREEAFLFVLSALGKISLSRSVREEPGINPHYEVDFDDYGRAEQFMVWDEPPRKFIEISLETEAALNYAREMMSNRPEFEGRLTALSSLGHLPPKKSKGPQYQILCLCEGNRARSPLMGFFLKKFLAEKGLGQYFSVTSAGTSSWIGRSYDGKDESDRLLEIRKNLEGALRRLGLWDTFAQDWVNSFYRHFAGDPSPEADLVLVPENAVKGKAPTYLLSAFLPPDDPMFRSGIPDSDDMKAIDFRLHQIFKQAIASGLGKAIEGMAEKLRSEARVGRTDPQRERLKIKPIEKLSIPAGVFLDAAELVHLSAGQVDRHLDEILALVEKHPSFDVYIDRADRYPVYNLPMPKLQKLLNEYPTRVHLGMYDRANLSKKKILLQASFFEGTDTAEDTHKGIRKLKEKYHIREEIFPLEYTRPGALKSFLDLAESLKPAELLRKISEAFAIMGPNGRWRMAEGFVSSVWAKMQASYVVQWSA